MRLYRIEPCGCGHTLAFAKQTGPHWGLYCEKCYKWVRWLSKKEKEIRDEYEKQRQPHK